MNTTPPPQRADACTHAALLEPPEAHKHAMKIMAKSLVRQLLAQGYEVSVLLSLIAEVIEAVTGEIQRTAQRSPPLDGSPQVPHLGER